MIQEFRELMITALGADTYSGPYANVVPKLASFPAIRYYVVSDTPIMSKTITTYGHARIQVDVYAKDSEGSLGPVDVVRALANKIVTIDGHLGGSENTIIEIRLDKGPEMDYDEYIETYFETMDFLVQHK
jgi:hypothetical protein